jgi:glycerol-1-phosphate dehydrogenase [NAD(P)+]
MTDILDKIKQAARGLDEEAQSAIEIDQLRIEAGAITHVAPYLQAKSYKNVTLVADANTYEIAGKMLMDSFSDSEISAHLTLVKANLQGDVIADEVSIIQLILDIQQFTTEVIVAVGSGTIHDIARYSAYTVGIPFVSVPTAPSVDGFNSKGAPIIIRGEKKTIQAIGPDAIFADLNILTKAPAAMVAAGFGDMLGKYTSLFDWKFGSLVAGEPYSQLVADITRNALQQCVDEVASIARRDEEGIRVLIGALIESGLAMLLFGQSHPASGAEHHLSHYWEMAYIRLGKRQLLHGAKVGVACAEISEFYHQLANNGFAERKSKENEFDSEKQHRRLLAIEANWVEIQKEISQIPDKQTIRDLLRTVGGPVNPQELGVHDDLLARSMQEAHHIRLNRYTLLRAYNETEI